MEALRHLTTDNPLQHRRLMQLEKLLEQANEIMFGLIASRHTFGAEAPTREIDTLLRGQAAVNRVRATVQELEAEERRLLAERVARAQSAARSTIRSAAVGGLLAITFIIGAGFVLRRDFRERVRIEQALLQSQQMFRRLFEDAPDATILVDRAARIVRANKQAEILFGWDREALAGKSIEELLPQRFHARHSGHLVAYFAAPRARAMGAGLELFARRQDGSEFPVDIMLSPLETDDGQQALAVIRDVTSRKASEEKIRALNVDLQLQNARLEIANKELESFSYSVSHDLRAPLRHIDGFAGLLTSHASGMLDEKGLRFISVIADSARRMGRLIDDLLTFSRMGRAQMAPGEIDHAELVASVVHEGGYDRDARVKWDIAPLPPVRADAAMLRLAWTNLIDNAVKYSSRAATPHIQVGRVESAPADHEQIFFIRDNGVGFDMKYAAKLFGVFQRLHSDAEFEGTGIGLANVRRIITRHGGRTWAESSVGGGATFYFSLPDTPV
jgi:PAS domain S-box-containing protein